MTSDGLKIDGRIEMRTSLKNSSKIGHEDFDFKYQMNKKRNESKLVKELKELREARKELREFE